MIQDITPHQYDNHYIEYQPQITDFCICIKDGTALLCQDKKEKNSWYIPTFKELAEPLYGAVYLFSIDGRHYFLKQMTGKDDTGLIEDESNMTSQIAYRHLKIQKDLREPGKTDVICVRLCLVLLLLLELRRFSLMAGIETIVTAVTAVAY